MKRSDVKAFLYGGIAVVAVSSLRLARVAYFYYIMGNYSKETIGIIGGADAPTALFLLPRILLSAAPSLFGIIAGTIVIIVMALKLKRMK